jgi:hypothetical protein
MEPDYHVPQALLLFHKRALTDKRAGAVRKSHAAKVAHNSGMLPKAAVTTNEVGPSRSTQSVEGTVPANAAGPSRPDCHAPSH